MEAETTGEVVDKPMEERQRKILRSARVGLVEDMNVREVLRHMTAVFTVDEEDKIKSPGNTRRVQCETFLDILPSRGAKAYDIFRKALRKVNSSLVEVLNQAELNVERQNSAGLEGKLRSLQTALDEERNKNQKIVEERDEFKKQLDAKNEKLIDEYSTLLKDLANNVQTMAELNKERQNSEVLGEKLRSLQASLDDEKIRKEEIEKERDELRKKLQERNEDFINAFKKRLIDVFNEEGPTVTTYQTDLQNLTDSKNNKQQVLNAVPGSDDVTTKENACTKEEKVKNILNQLERCHKEEIDLFEKAKELIGNYFHETTELVGNTETRRRTKPDVKQERSTLKSLEKECDLVKKVKKLEQREQKLIEEKGRLQKEITSLENKLIVKTKKIRENEDELSKGQDGREELQEQINSYSGKIGELQKDLEKWKSRTFKLQDDIRKTKTFGSSIFLPFGDHKLDVIDHLRKTKAKLGAMRSSNGPGEVFDVLSNRKGPTCGTEEKPRSWWWIDLGEKNLLFVTHCALTHKKKDPTLPLWELQGSTDGRDWMPLHITEKKELNYVSHLTATWCVDGKVGAYRYFKIVQTAKNSHGKHGICLSGIELYGVLLEIRPLEEYVKLEEC